MSKIKKKNLKRKRVEREHREPRQIPRVGENFQVSVPERLNGQERMCPYPSGSTPLETQLWAPPYYSNDTDDQKFQRRLSAFVKSITSVADSDLNFTEEQVLMILQKNKYDFNLTKADLKHYKNNKTDNDNIMDEPDIKKFITGLRNFGDDLYRISSTQNLNHKLCIEYFFRKQYGDRAAETIDDTSPSIKELVYFDQKRRDLAEKARTRGLRSKTTKNKENVPEIGEKSSTSPRKSLISFVSPTLSDADKIVQT